MDVARLAAVSQATVSYVLNGKSEGLVSDETRLRVLEAARSVGYRPNGLAQALLRGKTNTVGVFISFLGSRFHADVVLGAQETFDEHGYSLLLTASEVDHMARASRIEFMMNHRVDALMVVGGFYHHAEYPDWLNNVLAGDTPCVVVDDDSCRGKLDCVVSDDIDGIRQTVAHLAELGHRRIAYQPGAWTSSSAVERREGFLAAIADEGVECAELFCPAIPEDKDAELASIHRMLTAGQRPTAIITANDHMVADVVRTARELGLSLHGDLAVAGYGNQEISWVLDLTTVDQQPKHMGKVAAQRLLERLSTGATEPVTTRTPTRLIPRASTISPHANGALI
jgi:LacI family transcriptional regulator